MLETTLNEIRKYDPCVDGWEKALRFLGKTGADDEPLSLLTVLESNGLEDALWALRALDPKYDNAVRLYACFCAKYSLDIFERKHPDDKRPRQAIETAERFARRQVNKNELETAEAAAVAATWDAGAGAGAAARAAAGAAAGDAGAAAGDARDAARTAAWAAAGDAGAAAWAAAWDAFTAEFKRLCRLEGEYQNVK